MWKKGKTFALLVERQISAATVESSMEIPQKIKNGSAFQTNNPTSENIFEKTQNTNAKEQNTPMFIATLFTIAKIWKQPIDEWIEEMWGIYTMEYYSVIKKSEILPFATTWMNLEGIMLSEKSDRES